MPLSLPASGMGDAARSQTAASGLIRPSPAPHTGPTNRTVYPAPPGALVVAARDSATPGDDTAIGTLAEPLRTLARAVALAKPNDTIVLRGGTYRESVTTPAAKPLTIQRHGDERPVLDGSIPVTGWESTGPRRWRKTGWATQFRRGVPDPSLIDQNPLAGWPDQVFWNGIPLDQVASESDLTPETFCVDYTTATIWLETAGVALDPNGATVTASVLGDALVANGRITVRGLTFRRYATSQWRLGACRSYGARSVWEDCNFEHNAAAGLHVQTSDGTIVRQCTFWGNGQMGLRGFHWTSPLVERNYVAFNNRRRFASRGAAGGLKIDTESTRAVIRGNFVEANHGHGIWLDIGDDNAEIVDNRVLHHDTGAGIFFELSSGALIAGNDVACNLVGILVSEAGGANLWNNTLVDNTSPIVFQLGGRSQRTGCQARNNLIIQHDTAGSVLTAIDTVGDGRDHLEAGWTSDTNAVWRADPTGSSYATVTMPDRTRARFATRDEYVAATGNEALGLSADRGDDPWSDTDAEGHSLRLPRATIRDAGTPLPPEVREALGVTASAFVGSTPPLQHYGSE